MTPFGCWRHQPNPTIFTARFSGTTQSISMVCGFTFSIGKIISFSLPAFALTWGIPTSKEHSGQFPIALIFDGSLNWLLS